MEPRLVGAPARFLILRPPPTLAALVEGTASLQKIGCNAEITLYICSHALCMWLMKRNMQSVQILRHTCAMAKVHFMQILHKSSKPLSVHTLQGNLV